MTRVPNAFTNISFVNHSESHTSLSVCPVLKQYTIGGIGNKGKWLIPL